MSAGDFSDPVVRRRNSKERIPPDLSDLRIVLLGNSVSETSSVGNFILGREAFDTEAPSSDLEQYCEKVRGKQMTVINNPLLLNPDLRLRHITQGVRECVYQSAPGPHVIVLVLNHECSREEAVCVDIVLSVFSERVFEHTMVLTTQEPERVELNEVSDVVKEIIQKCFNRHYRRGKNSTSADLIATIKEIVQRNDGRPLICDKYLHFTADGTLDLIEENEGSKEEEHHVKIEEKTHLQTDDILKRRDKNRFICTQCGKSFGRKGNLKTHMMIHTGEKPFTCTQCGKSFNRSSHLNEHMRIHTGENPFTCTQCGKSFSQSSHLNYHMKIHTGEKRFTCTQCGKSFRQSSSLTLHMMIHTGEKPFTCTQCWKSYSRSSHLYQHMRIHTVEKPFTCTQCGKSFNRSSDLHQHMTIHTGEKPFTCVQCGKSFNFSSTLYKHMKIHTGEKPFTCTQCGKSFNFSSTLYKHMKIHTGE